MKIRTPSPARLLLVVLLTSFLISHSAPAAPANVIIILADDLGQGDLGCYGHPQFKTPRLDRMAAEGARLTHFNTPFPFCAPTRASLLTGRYPHRCGMTGNPAPDGDPESKERHLPESEILLPQLLVKAGYATAIVGKWHLGHARPEWMPTHRGFGSYFGIPYSNDMRPVHLVEGDRVVEYPVIQAHLTRRLTDRALTFIEENRTRPFFLYLAHPMPHKPLAASEAYYKKSGAGLYGDVVRELDACVGEVLDKVKSLGLDERTLVVFTSDNGPFFGGRTGGLRGMKGSTFEGGFRVPCIARWPGKIPGGHVSAQPAVMMDLFSTTLKAAGVEPPADRVIDGRDIMPLFTSDAKSPHEVILGALSAVRDARWKLHVLRPGEGLRNLRAVEPGKRWIDPRGPDGVTILAPYEQYDPTFFPGVPTGPGGRAMTLFDLENDPAEQQDVAAQHPDEVRRLKAAWDEYARDFPPAPPAGGKK